MHKILRPQRYQRYQKSRNKRTVKLKGSNVIQIKSIVSADGNSQSENLLPDDFDMDGDWEIVEDDDEVEDKEDCETHCPDKEETILKKESKTRRHKLVQIIEHFAKKYGVLIEVVIVIPILLMAFYILFIEQRSLFSSG